MAKLKNYLFVTKGVKLMKRDFKEWLKTFRNSICDYGYYVDFNKVYGNVETIKVELNILNSLSLSSRILIFCSIEWISLSIIC